MGDGAMLACAELGQVASPMVSIGSGNIQALQHFLAVSCQQTKSLCCVHSADSVFILFVACHIAGSVAAIVSHIKGLIASRSRGDMS